MNSFKYRFAAVISSIILVGAAFFGGVYIGYESKTNASGFFLLNKGDSQATSTNAFDFSPFWKAWSVIEDKYIEPDKVADQAKVWGAIEGLAKSLGDPYTVFLPPVENKAFEEEISGNFEGVGMEVGIRDDILTVIAPIKGNPAEKAGIKSGDQIIKIDEKISADLSVDEAVKLIRGPKGSDVKLTIRRESRDSLLEFTLTRDVITIPTIDNELRDDGVYVIRLYNFSAVSTGLFREALNDFLKSGSNKLIFDLRGNPGGYLEASVDIASWFLPKGKVVVREDFGGKREENVYRSRGNNIIKDNLKMVVLVDGGSASASEILAGALSEHGVATLVGTKTFGKGSVQELVKITDDTSLKVTIAKWLTPNGKSISDGGLIPDYEVEITEEDVEKLRDSQMEKAVEILNNS
ncbi:MAG: hypothetical protein A3G52_00025 [Candidatus Taylorbacteria bacterium RIFCSPLOWO2_12_FULL_43_20]|uniref:PDZ domain-containing protein n=1 Tax=Candidatus Taylorbacteria bacterium RIFCSPLOWO2_12_FULL_43_20 TaxID=1802332 RepID=A0A1G2P2N4_9BACT|nr:MAG: hypothetical protein A2825_03080 [Candidatus Taylorbacteria bacterium RIFCSPHIGHO2_01_FULL_43_120]OHA22948.1 MAG: hypothetical protein A3B98_02815 [Candidatus Taylorbacteria bacterium RIFCSPHIGHO2_02_FULL_43_55]OHA30187.1 MAG: hypothetical protein A3E92_01180 [Candidatus Taylorbacteria bacterium RIFCSPHIGHO2_12_FULL_42_34]OHA31934.1 MAG: hypothetical protein A3B09_00935 [Candidatus Taylorbacteria bacterium RIFCSPLOWO2_01_FULL_43_83]OHA37957.1 MAG: hypothetical protein A3H58_01350 [Candi